MRFSSLAFLVAAAFMVAGFAAGSTGGLASYGAGIGIGAAIVRFGLGE